MYMEIYKIESSNDLNMPMPCLNVLLNSNGRGSVLSDNGKDSPMVRYARDALIL